MPIWVRLNLPNREIPACRVQNPIWSQTGTRRQVVGPSLEAAKSHASVVRLDDEINVPSLNKLTRWTTVLGSADIALSPHHDNIATDPNHTQNWLDVAQINPFTFALVV